MLKCWFGSIYFIVVFQICNTIILIVCTRKKWIGKAKMQMNAKKNDRRFKLGEKSISAENDFYHHITQCQWHRDCVNAERERRAKTKVIFACIYFGLFNTKVNNGAWMMRWIKSSTIFAVVDCWFMLNEIVWECVCMQINSGHCRLSDSGECI